MKGESLLLSGMGVVIVRRCRLCVPDSPGGASRFVCDIHNKIYLALHVGVYSKSLLELLANTSPSDSTTAVIGG